MFERNQRHLRHDTRTVPAVKPCTVCVSSPAARGAAAPSTLGHPTAAGTGDDTYLMRLKALRDQRDAIVERTAPGLPGHRAVEWLRALGESFQVADVPKEREELMHAIDERITVAGPSSVFV